MHELDDPRDVDPAYILGAFDARRMIRLEGMPSNLARQQSQAYVSAQSEFPSFDRNVSYVTLSIRYDQVGRSTPLAFNAGWAVGQNLYRQEGLKYGPGVSGLWGAICLGGDRVGTTALYNEAIRLATAERERLREERAKLYAGSVLTGPVATVGSVVETALIHEHGHSLFNELALADQVLGTRNMKQIESAIQRVIPLYLSRHHSFDVSRSVESLLPEPLVGDLAKQGVGQPGWRNMDELTAEVLRLSFRGNSSPLIDAVTDVMRELCSLQSDSRIRRQERLFEVCQNSLPTWRRFGGGIPLPEPLLTDASDARFLLTALSNNWYALGRSQIARIDPDEIEWSVPEARGLSRLMAQQLDLSPTELSATVSSPVLEF